jgi:hypothetical protein
MQRDGKNGKPITLLSLAAHKHLPVEFMQDLGLHDLPGGGVGIPYFDITGNEIAIKRRTQLRARDGSYWPKGKPLASYGDWRLDRARKEGRLFLVEGESDCWALWHHGLPALGLPGADTVNKTLQAEHLECIPTVYVHHEPDQGGETFVHNVLRRLGKLGYRGRIYELRCPGGVKDPADLHAQDGEKFQEHFEAAIKVSMPLEVGAEVGRPNEAVEESWGLATTCLATICPRPVHWLVPNYLPLGKLVMLAGDGGHGKSTLTLSLAACLTTGRPCFGLDYESAPPADVLLISCEDDYEDTVVPRLLSAGADLHRIFRVDGITGKSGKVLPFSLAHYERMEEELRARPGVRLVIIDPAGAYIGKAGVDDYKDSELRSLLDPMAELAARCRVTILIVKHLVKGATAKAIHKVAGSAGYINGVRAAFVVLPDSESEDQDRRLFLPLKFNLGPKPSGLAYRCQSLSSEEQIETLSLSPFHHLDADDCKRLGAQLFRLEWLGAVTVDADAALAETAKHDRDPNKVDRAAEWLEKFLAQYAYPSDEIAAAGKEAGFTKDNLYRAKEKLGKDKICASNRGVFQGQWHWGSGAPSNWTLRPIPWRPNDASPETAKSPNFPNSGEEHPETGPKFGNFGMFGVSGERNGVPPNSGSRDPNEEAF